MFGAWLTVKQGSLISMLAAVQVTRKDQVPPGTRTYPVRPLDAEQSDGRAQRSGWRNRFRSLFCCGAPIAREGTYPRNHADAVVIRPPQPPTPPRSAPHPFPLSPPGPLPAPHPSYYDPLQKSPASTACCLGTTPEVPGAASILGW